MRTIVHAHTLFLKAITDLKTETTDEWSLISLDHLERFLTSCPPDVEDFFFVKLVLSGFLQMPSDWKCEVKHAEDT